MDSLSLELITKFFDMARNGDLEGLENIIENEGNCITKKHMTEAFYKCCLHYKVMGQHENCLNLFIRKKADIDAIHRESGLSPLMVCCQKGCSDLVQFLLNNGAYPNVSNRGDKKTALHWAIDTKYGENTNIVSMLIEHARCNVNQTSSDGYTPLALAINRNQQKTIKLLLKADANYNQKHPNGTHLLEIFKKKNWMHLLDNMNSTNQEPIAPLQQETPKAPNK